MFPKDSLGKNKYPLKITLFPFAALALQPITALFLARLQPGLLHISIIHTELLLEAP
jgi:hypothetical protein